MPFLWGGVPWGVLVNRQWAVDDRGVVLVWCLVIQRVGLTVSNVKRQSLLGLRRGVATSLTATWPCLFLGSFVALGPWGYRLSWA